MSVPAPAAPAPAPEKFRVLIVEDDPSIARLVRSNLSKANLDCRIAEDGHAGIAAFREFNPHLVLTDLMMPGLDGRGLCAAVREISMVPIIMMTAANTSEAELQAFKAGADDYIAKPFDPKLLVARVIATLRRVYRYDASAYQDAAREGGASPGAMPLLAAPDTARSEAAKNEAARSEAAKSEAAKSEAARSEAAKNEAVKNEAHAASAPPASGAITCQSCGYGGTRAQFRTVNERGQRVLLCPQCGETDAFLFS